MSVAPDGVKPTIEAHRPRRIGLRPRQARDGRRNSSTRCQMQKSAAEKFHGVPPWRLDLVGSSSDRSQSGYSPTLR